MKTDIVVVGAGIAGIVMAERYASQGKSVLIIEKRSHIGGNCYDCHDDNGILIHPYGPHIFHTEFQDVWEYLSRFTTWQTYQHRVLAQIDGNLVPLPFNLNSIDMLFPAQFASRVSDQLINTFGFGARVPILKLRENSNNDLRLLADYVYDKVFLNYTRKQWGLSPEEIDPSVTARVPVLVSRDDRYFQDPFQGIPQHGYTRMFTNMLDKPNISILLNTDYLTIRNDLIAKEIIYTGPLDEYFDSKHGSLPYRSIDFIFETHVSSYHQQTAVINYPNDYAYTRVTEFKHLTGQRHECTVTLKEFPQNHIAGKTTPCYPIPQETAQEKARLYQAEIPKNNNTTFIGRLAEYRYYNMDQIVKRALDIFN